MTHYWYLHWFWITISINLCLCWGAVLLKTTDQQPTATLSPLTGDMTVQWSSSDDTTISMGTPPEATPPLRVGSRGAKAIGNVVMGAPPTLYSTLSGLIGSTTTPSRLALALPPSPAPPSTLPSKASSLSPGKRKWLTTVAATSIQPLVQQQLPAQSSSNHTRSMTSSDSSAPGGKPNKVSREDTAPHRLKETDFPDPYGATEPIAGGNKNQKLESVIGGRGGNISNASDTAATVTAGEDVEVETDGTMVASRGRFDVNGNSSDGAAVEQVDGGGTWLGNYTNQGVGTEVAANKSSMVPLTHASVASADIKLADTSGAISISGDSSIASSSGPLTAAGITGITLGCVAIVGLLSAISFLLYRYRTLNRPETLNDYCSNLDSSGYIDDTSIRDNSEEMYSLDNDSFLNSLEAMTIQNYWTDTVKHTKL